MSTGDHQPRKKPRSHPADLERKAEEARKKLAEAERYAEETLEIAADELRELTEDQEKTAERLRREVRELPGPLLPEAPTSEDESPKPPAGPGDLTKETPEQPPGQTPSREPQSKPPAGPGTFPARSPKRSDPGQREGLGESSYRDRSPITREGLCVG
jgi:hypothetical protein